MRFNYKQSCLEDYLNYLIKFIQIRHYLKAKEDSDIFSIKRKKIRKSILNVSHVLGTIVART